MINVSLELIKPSLEELKKKLGIKDQAQEAVLKGIMDELFLGRDARFWFKKIETKSAVLKELLLSSIGLSSALKGYTEYFVVICTIGDVKQKKEPVATLYLDKAASELCENLAEYSAKFLLKRYHGEEGYELSKRYSPGYGDLRLERQKDLFSLFEDEELGVKLSSSFYMEPEKSISYLVGVRKK